MTGLGASFGAASTATAASAAGWPVWVVSSGRGLVYLTGETPPRDADWSDARTEGLLARCGALWTETNDVARASPASLMQRYGLDPGAGLMARLSAAEKERFAAAASLTHTPMEQLAHLRPWLAGYLLQQAYYQAFDLKGATANQVLARSAAKAGLASHSEFPTQDEAIAWFGALTPAQDLQFLLYTLDDLLRPRQEVDGENAAWARGDLEGTTADLTRMRHRHPEIYEAILVRRNRGWASRFKAMMTEPKPSLVVVGDFHLAGPDSIQAQLKAAGLRVRRL
jgi:uncharacterized protein YbaP (TraB family)